MLCYAVVYVIVLCCIYLKYYVEYAYLAFVLCFALLARIIADGAQASVCSRLLCWHRLPARCWLRSLRRQVVEFPGLVILNSTVVAPPCQCSVFCHWFAVGMIFALTR